MHTQQPQNSAVLFAGRNYTNVALTAITLLLGVIALNLTGAISPNTAHAQVGVVGGKPVEVPSDGLVSAAEQRKTMTNELRLINERLDRILGSLEKGVSVRVTAMPDGERPSDKADSRPVDRPAGQ